MINETQNPFEEPLRELGEVAITAEEILRRLRPITRRPSLAGVRRARRIFVAAQDREIRRELLEQRLDADVVDAVNEDLVLEEGDDSVKSEYWGSLVTAGCRFSAVAATTLEIEIEDDAALGFYIEKKGVFSGVKEGNRWMGTVRKHKRRGRYVTLTLDIEAD